MGKSTVKSNKLIFLGQIILDLSANLKMLTSKLKQNSTSCVNKF